MKSNRVLDLPISGSGCGDILIRADSVNVLIDYEYYSNGKDCIGSILFEGAVTFKFTDELHAKDVAEGSYDCVVLVTDSIWLATISEIDQRNKALVRSPGRRKHYAVYFSSNGYFEVIADSVKENGTRFGLIGNSTGAL